MEWGSSKFQPRISELRTAKLAKGTQCDVERDALLSPPD